MKSSLSVTANNETAAGFLAGGDKNRQPEGAVFNGLLIERGDEFNP